ncbi:histidine kinase [Lamprobacter modestohalophilus]|uniref:histidine kinase n=1 Tax=Lamprobacter modestohalophilus TaxID=1064514 RepID=A0A9X0WDT1_9GAMM|nr:HAMP domain-containing sensor histidine kinase [Lamprobacter modestohalophilus]MBK1621589.1 histidine kinase [Lamprobacter modestohalophilus]
MSLSRHLASLSLQVAAAYLALGLLLSAASLYTLSAFQRQLGAIELVNRAGQLELAVEQMHAQAMNYWQNAPRDYPTYYRDVRLYYQDLLTQIETIDGIVATFMSGDFSDAMPMPMPAWLQPHLGLEAEAAIAALEDTWETWRATLFDALGDDEDEPRLEWAAEQVIDDHSRLNAAVEVFAKALRSWSAREYQLMIQGTLAAAGITLVIAVLLLWLLHWKVLAPLRRTTAGFQRVADGDVRYQLPVVGTTELQDLSSSFNRLSERLDLLYRLIHALQQGQDLDQLMGLLNTEFRPLLGCDWSGLVFIDERRASARVETSWLDGLPQPGAQRLYRLQGTLLERVLADETPLHVQAMAERASANPAYELLRHLVALGMRDAIFLPLTPQTQTPIPAVVVFATRDPAGFGDARQRLLGNIGQLLTQGVGRTARLAEQGRLAAIGEFASGIVHELRTPLSTIAMALSYLAEGTPEPRAKRRLDLALGEAERTRRLLEEILLYAKPLSLDPRPVALRPLLEEQIAMAAERHPGHSIQLEQASDVFQVLADPDRLRQILTNLTDNACEAAPVGSVVTWRIAKTAGLAETAGTARTGETAEAAKAAGIVGTAEHVKQSDADEVRLSVHNTGEPIPAERLPRLSEPFFSTKASGTGLGLAIVARLVEQHGGRLSIRSTAEQGTLVEIVLPQWIDETDGTADVADA